MFCQSAKKECQLIVSHQKFNCSLRGEIKGSSIFMNLKHPTVQIQGEICPYWCPSAYWPSCKSDPVCQGAATISMKLVQPYRGPWASQRWTAIWRLCRPFCVVFPTFLEQLLKNMIVWSFFVFFEIKTERRWIHLETILFIFQICHQMFHVAKMNLIHL